MAVGVGDPRCSISRELERERRVGAGASRSRELRGMLELASQALTDLLVEQQVQEGGWIGVVEEPVSEEDVVRLPRRRCLLEHLDVPELPDVDVEAECVQVLLDHLCVAPAVEEVARVEDGGSAGIRSEASRRPHVTAGGIERRAACTRHRGRQVLIRRNGGQEVVAEPRVPESGERPTVDRVADGPPQARIGEERSPRVQLEVPDAVGRIDEVPLPAVACSGTRRAVPSRELSVDSTRRAGSPRCSQTGPTRRPRRPAPTVDRPCSGSRVAAVASSHRSSGSA